MAVRVIIRGERLDQFFYYLAGVYERERKKATSRVESIWIGKGFIGFSKISWTLHESSETGGFLFTFFIFKD